MIERTVKSYGYTSHNKDMMSQRNFMPGNAAVVTKMSAKQSVRRRVENARNRQHSDIESDTGSDGLAVNSGGSGRSGDWEPPKRKLKPRSGKRRVDLKPSLTDSGISLSKADSESLSEISCQRLDDDVIIRCSTNVTPGSRYSESNSRKPSTKISASSADVPYHRNLLKRTNSCSALTSNIIPLDKHNPSISSQARFESQLSDIELKENSILHQCYGNEVLTEYSDNRGHSYIFDCSTPLEQSKFPLPERLNYPLCKYRHKSESILNRATTKPLKKLKDSWKKLKSRRSSQEMVVEPINTLSSDTGYLDYLQETYGNNDALSQLETVPKQRKSFLKKLIVRIAGSRTYKVVEEAFSSNENSERVMETNFKRSTSTRSIPESIKNMWNKVHDLDFDQASSPGINTLSRALSMPSISNIYPKTHVVNEVIYFNEPGLKHKEPNYFSNFFKPMELTKPIQCKPKLKPCGGDDVITSVLGMETTNEDHINKEPYDKTLSCESNAEAEITRPIAENHEEKMESYKLDSQNNNYQLVTSKPTDMYSSCYELSLHKSYFYNPQQYYSPHMIQNTPGHCQCCIQSRLGSKVYESPSYFQTPYINQMIGSPRQSLCSVLEECVKRDNVIAPLDVKKSSERRAERRKISDMIFDTFV